MKKNIFVIPFAGGSSHSFNGWHKHEMFEFVFIDMPGKGTREGEALLSNFQEMVEEGVSQITKYLALHEKSLFYIWGHSMGSFLAYEIVCRLSQQNMCLPEKLIMSATMPPECFDYERMEDYLSEENKFMQYIISFGLVSQRIANSRFFRSKFLPPILRDYEIMSEYRKCSNILKSQPVIIMNGIDDEYSKEDVMKWKYHFDVEPDFYWLVGGHFFIFQNADAVFDLLNEVL